MFFLHGLQVCYSILFYFLFLNKKILSYASFQAASTKSLKDNHVLPRQLWKNKNKYPSQKNQVPKATSGLPSLMEINK